MGKRTQLGKILEFIYRTDLIRKLPEINDESFFYDVIIRLANDFEWDVELAVKFMEQVYQDWDIDPTTRSFNEDKFLEEFTSGILDSTNSDSTSLRNLLGFNSNDTEAVNTHEPSI